MRACRRTRSIFALPLIDFGAIVVKANVAQAVNWRASARRYYWVDVGSRGGFRDMRLLHPLVHMYSFDPDTGIAPPPLEFASFRHFPFALHSAEGETDLFVTARPGMSSLLEFDEAVFHRHFGLVPGSRKWEEDLSLAYRQRTEMRKADDVFRDQGIPRVDFLKLDTQGTELEVLKGAEGYLSSRRVSVIKTEVSFLPVYRNQCLFGDIDRYLRQHGFVFVDCMFYPDAVYERKTARAVRGARLQEEPRFSAVGDAVYVLDPSRFPEADRPGSTIRSAILLNQMGYVSFAFDLLKRSGYSVRTAEELLRATGASKDFKTSAKRLLKTHLPPWAYRGAKRLHASLFAAK